MVREAGAREAEGTFRGAACLILRGRRTAPTDGVWMATSERLIWPVVAF